PTVAIFDHLPEMDPEWLTAFDRTVAGLRERDVRIVTVDPAPFLAAAKLLYEGALVAERYCAVGEFVDPDATAADVDSVGAATVDETVGAIIRAARDLPAHRLVGDLAELERLRGLAMASLDGADALLAPTAPFQPTIAEVAADPIRVNSRVGTYTNFCNLFDLCAVAVPAGTAGGAQFGVTVFARAFDDAVAIDIAALVPNGTAT